MRGSVEVQCPLEVRIIDACQIDGIIAARKSRRLVQQQMVSHGFHCRHHADGVVIAQHRIGGALDMCVQASQSLNRGFIGTICKSPIISGQHAEVIIQRLYEPDQHLQKCLVHIEVKIGEMQEGEPLEGIRQMWKIHLTMADFYRKGVAPASLVQTKEAQSSSDQGGT